MTIMKREFCIYKEGVTAGKIAIMSREGEPFDYTAKVQKFRALGYRVYKLDGTEIK